MSKRKTLAVETVAIDSLTAHPRNYRGHPDAQVAEIGKSLEKFGQYKPVVVSSDGVILAGHGVWTAQKAQGAKDVAVVRMDFPSTDPRAEKLMVADNELSRMAVDDDRALAALLADVQRTEGLSGTGWDDGGLDALIGEIAKQNRANAPLEDPGPEEPPVDPVTRLGDVWLMGEHRLVCGDCTDAAVVAGLFGDKRGRMVWTDPPYGVNYGNHNHPSWGNHAPIANDALDDDGMAALWVSATTNLAAFVDGDMYVAAPPGPLLRLMDVALETPEWERHQWLVWVKNSLVLGRSNYHYRHEQIWYGWRRGGKSSWEADRTHDSVFEVDRPSRSEEHPTMKPVELVAQMVANSSKPGDIVADPFLGSGTTLIAAEQLNRVCYGIEIEPRYVDVAVRRWCNATGRVATLEATGESFPMPAPEGA
jgi:DNA modification methylase